MQRVAAGFLGLLQGLQRLSPEGDNARVVLLTPGPHNETYFEHAFLSRYLGMTLVEGGDLTVRGERLFLKTLHGLEPVHVLLRRVDDEYLDPLELRGDSALGVPGLLGVIRAGQVVVANAPGAGFLESPGLAAFWPADRAPPAGRGAAAAVDHELVVRRGQRLGARSASAWPSSSSRPRSPPATPPRASRRTASPSCRPRRARRCWPTSTPAPPPTRCRRACGRPRSRSGTTARWSRARRWCACSR